MPENNDNPTIQESGNDNAATNRVRQNWPLRDIKEPHENDVLYGRGGGTNHHAGNKRYRKMVEDRKIDYVNSKRLDKPVIAIEIIRQWRGQDPPGRFLKQSETTGLWFDVGDKKAREKTSQALREKAPLIRKQQEQKLRANGGAATRERGNDSDYHPSSEDDNVVSPVPRNRNRVGFSDPPESKSSDPKLIKRSILMRDHSLGREYLKPDESITIEGFSWDEPTKVDENEKQNPTDSTSYPTLEPESHLPENADDWNRTQLAPPHYPNPHEPIAPAKPMKGREHSLAANPLENATNAPIDPRFIGWDNPNPGYNFPPPLKKDYSPNNSGGAIERSNSGGSSSKFFPETNALYRSWSGDGMMYPYNDPSFRRSTSGQSDDYRRPSPYDPMLQPQYTNNTRFPNAPIDDNVVFSRASSIQSEDFKQPTRSNSFPPPLMQPGAPYNHPEPGLEREVSLNFPSSVFENSENDMPPPNWGTANPNQYYNSSPHSTPHSSFTDMPMSPPQPAPRAQRSTSRMSWEATMTLGRNKRSSSIGKKVETPKDTKPTSVAKPELKKDMSMGTFLNGVFDGPSTGTLPDVDTKTQEKTTNDSTQQTSTNIDNSTQSNVDPSNIPKQNKETIPPTQIINLNTESTSSDTSPLPLNPQNINKVDNKDNNTDISTSKPMQLNDRFSSIGTFLPNDVYNAAEKGPAQDKGSQSGTVVSEASDYDEVTTEPVLQPPLAAWVNHSNNTDPIDYGINPPAPTGHNRLPSSEPLNVGKAQDRKEFAMPSMKRPNAIKRATSNQNEDVFTKRDLKLTKRLPISRDESQSTDAEDNSLSADNQFSNVSTENQFTPLNDDDDMRRLSFSMGNSKLVDSSSKPSLLKEKDRVSTIDIISADMKTWIDNI